MKFDLEIFWFLETGNIVLAGDLNARGMHFMRASIGVDG